MAGHKQTPTFRIRQQPTDLWTVEHVEHGDFDDARLVATVATEQLAEKIARRRILAARGKTANDEDAWNASPESWFLELAAPYQPRRHEFLFG